MSLDRENYLIFYKIFGYDEEYTLYSNIARGYGLRKIQFWRGITSGRNRYE